MKYIFYLSFLLCAKLSVAQVPADTGTVQSPELKRKSQALVKNDTIPKLDVVMDTAIALQAGDLKPGSSRLSYRKILKANPYYNFFAAPESRYVEERQIRGKDALFYLLAGMLLFFALIKLLFSRYVNNLLGLVFRGSLRQKQIREQLLQTPLPSLFLNIFFVMVAGLYIFFLLQYYKMVTETPFWLVLLYCIVTIGIVYLVKFLILKFTGWIFNMRDAADTYIFIVFLVNKLLAIFLLPLLVIMAFSLAAWTKVLITLSYVLILVFFAYRYLVSFAPVRREVKVSQFHFFMYLCAFEIIPLLLIYKVLLRYF